MNTIYKIYLTIYKYVTEIVGTISGWLSIKLDFNLINISVLWGDVHDILKAFICGAAGGYGAYWIKRILTRRKQNKT